MGKPHEVGTTELPDKHMSVKSRQMARPFGIFLTSASCSKAACRQRQSGCPQGRFHPQNRDSKEGLKMCENTQQDSHLDVFIFGPENTRIL